MRCPGGGSLFEEPLDEESKTQVCVEVVEGCLFVFVSGWRGHRNVPDIHPLPVSQSPPTSDAGRKARTRRHPAHIPARI